MKLMRNSYFSMCFKQDIPTGKMLKPYLNRQLHTRVLFPTYLNQFSNLFNTSISFSKQNFHFNTKQTTGLQVHSSVETSKQYLQTTNYLTKVYIPQFIMQSSALINVKLFEYEMYRSHTSINFIVLLLTFYILFFRYIFYCIQYDNIHAFRVSIERIMKIVCNGGDIVHGI